MKTTKFVFRHLSPLLVGTVAATMCIPVLSSVARADDLQSSTATNCKQVLDQWGIIDVDPDDGTITSNVDLSNASQVFNVYTINQLFCIGAGSYEVDGNNDITNTGVNCNDSSGAGVLTGLMHARYVQANNLDFNDLTVSEATVNGALRWRPIGNNGC